MTMGSDRFFHRVSTWFSGQTAAALHITGFANIVGSEPSGTSSEAEPLPGSSDERELSQAQNSPAKRSVLLQMLYMVFV